MQSNNINNLIKNSTNINSNYKRNSSQSSNNQASKIPMKTAVQLLQQQQQNLHQQQQRRSISNNNFMITGSNISPTNSAGNSSSNFKLNNPNSIRNQDVTGSSPTPPINKV